MIRIGASFWFRSTSQGCSLVTHPFKRVQFGITAGILLSGLIAAFSTGSLDEGFSPGFLVFLLLLVVTGALAGYTKKVNFVRNTSTVELSAKFFFIPLIKPRVYPYTREAEIILHVLEFFPKGLEPKESGFQKVQARALKKSLVKLIFQTGTQALYLDESSVFGEAEMLANQLSHVLSIPIVRRT